MNNEIDINELEKYLDLRGLSFRPLRAEILDHLITDIEQRMQNGDPFHIAWGQVRKEIPANHFKDIQQQTMETIESRFRISRIFSNLFLSLIILSSFFKFMHLPGAGMLLMGSYASLFISLLSGSLSGIYINKTKKGAVWVVSIVLGILILLFAFSFRVFHLPGVEQLAVLAVAIILISSIVVTFIVKNHQSGDESLLTYLHEKYTSSIQRSLLVLLGVGVLFKVVAIAKGSDYFVGDITLIMMIYGAGLHLLVFFWRSIEARTVSDFIPLVIIVSFTSLLLTILNFYIPIYPRMVMAAIFYIGAGYLVYIFLNEGTNKPVAILFMIFNFTHFLFWVLIDSETINWLSMDIIYNLPVVGMFLIPLWLFRKDSMMLTFWLIAVASFTLQYGYHPFQ